MTYQEKVKKSKKIRKSINSLGIKEEIKVTYGVDRVGKPAEYTIRAYSGFKGENNYAISEANSFMGRSMNVDKVTNTMLRCYSFDLMSQRTTYNFPLYLLKIV
jgi:hypothetical protein